MEKARQATSNGADRSETNIKEASTYYVAYIDYRDGNYNNALIEFSPSERKSPKYREQSQYFIAQIYLSRANTKKVVKEGEELLSLYPDSQEQ